MTANRELYYSMDDIDNAAGATQDPNPLHHPTEWEQVRGNIFGGPIALALQVASMIDTEFSKLRLAGDTDSIDHASCYYDIRYIQPVHPLERLSLQFKAGGYLKCDQKLSIEQQRHRFSLYGRSGITTIGLKQIYADEFTTSCIAEESASTAWNEKKTDGMCETEYYKKNQPISLREGKRFLAASSGKHIDEEICTNRSCAHRDELVSKNMSNIPPLYPVALTSSILATCPLLSNLDLVLRPLVYSRLKLYINNSVINTIRDGEVLSYLVGGDGIQSVLCLDSQRRCVVQAAAMTSQRQLVFSGEFSLLQLNSPPVCRASDVEQCV